MTRRPRTPMARRHKMANDCLILLQYCATHPNEEQTEQSLANATGIPRRTLSLILREARQDRFHSLPIRGKEDRFGSLLVRVACKYRFDFEISRYPKRGHLLSAVYVGYW